MRSVRLLPVVIFAALALLLFKGVGLVTNGGYVLTGPAAVVANEGGAEPDMPVSPTPSEAVMTDSSPTLGESRCRGRRRARCTIGISVGARRRGVVV